MRRFAAALVLLEGVAVSTARAAEPVPPSVDLPAELARVLTEYEDAWSRKDAAALSRLFAEDGWLLSSGRPAVHGRAAIEKAYTGSGGPLALRAYAFATHGDLGWILGGFAHRRGDSDGGKFTLTLRREGAGRWMIVSDMDNGNDSR